MDELVEDGYYGEKLCRPCDRWFKDHTAVLQHFVYSGRHDYCERCDREFKDWNAKQQHLSSSNSHNICHLLACRNSFKNGADWETRAELLEHFESDIDHNYCLPCKRDFASLSERLEHWRNSVAHNWCDRCQRDFNSETALAQHKQTSSRHFQCRVCKSDFQQSNELIQHQKIHQPRTVTCACPQRFANFSALMIHWEAGMCTTNRLFLNRLVLSFPEHRHFAVKEYIGRFNRTEDRFRKGDDQDYDCYSKTWDCPIQDGCNGRYKSLAVLNQHLASPYHDVPLFKCPDTICDKRFSCLSGLLQHVENSSCSEGINGGTGCLGRLWLFLLEKFSMAVEKEDVGLYGGRVYRGPLFVGFSF